MSRFWNRFVLVISLTACSQDGVQPGPDGGHSRDAMLTADGAVPDGHISTIEDSGTDGAIENCACNTPPPSTCLDSNTLVVFDASGVCTSGECSYTSAEMPCLLGCTDGACNAEGTTFEAYLKASNTDTHDNLGRSISLSGDLLAVGAIGEDSASRGVNGDQANNDASRSGAVYVFRRDASGTWMQEAYIKSSNHQAGDNFGRSVSLSDDLLAVGANGDDSAANNGGAVYVFRRSTTGSWVEEARLVASNADADDNFGWSVSLSGDLLAVGVPYEGSAATGVNRDQTNNDAIDSGAVYLFRHDETWTQEAYLKASNTDADDRFGWSVSLSGDLLAVGAYKEDSSATGIGGDPSDNSANDSGAVYVFRHVETWEQEAYLKASDLDAEDWFGWSVSASGDSVVVGALNETVYVFRRSSSGEWSEETLLRASTPGEIDYFGTSVFISGDLLVVGADGEDSAAIGANGDESSHGARNSGAVYLFRRSEDGAWTQELYLKAPNTGAEDRFGCSVALSGTLLAVGAYGESSSATGVNGNQLDNSAESSGAVYIYR